MCPTLIDNDRWEIEKKLRDAKRKERLKDKKTTVTQNKNTVTQRSMDRRKIVEDKAKSKKLSAFQEMIAKREERKQSKSLLFHLCLGTHFRIDILE